MGLRILLSSIKTNTHLNCKLFAVEAREGIEAIKAAQRRKNQVEV